MKKDLLTEKIVGTQKGIIIDNVRTVDKKRLTVLRMLKNEVEVYQKDVNKNQPITDEMFEAVVQKMIKDNDKKIKENYSVDFTNNCVYENDIYKEFLPVQLTDEELLNLVRNISDRTGFKSLAFRGQLIKEVKTEVGTLADGSRVSSSVLKYISSLSEVNK